MRVEHTFEPIYDEQSRILILGTFPSVKSRQEGFYYGHPQNRFWKVLSGLLHQEIPLTIEDKKFFLLKNQIALWDVIQSCRIIGSSDSSIKDVIPNDLKRILDKASIQAIYANGKKAENLYKKYCRQTIGREIIALASTSSANAAFSLERLIENWKLISYEGNY